MNCQDASFAVAPEQFQSRRDALLIAIAPLSLFIFLMVPLLLEPIGMISGVLGFVLVVNITGTVWDLYTGQHHLREACDEMRTIDSIRKNFPGKRRLAT